MPSSRCASWPARRPSRRRRRRSRRSSKPSANGLATWCSASRTRNCRMRWRVLLAAKRRRWRRRRASRRPGGAAARPCAGHQRLVSRRHHRLRQPRSRWNCSACRKRLLDTHGAVSAAGRRGDGGRLPDAPAAPTWPSARPASPGPTGRAPGQAGRSGLRRPGLGRRRLLGAVQLERNARGGAEPNRQAGPQPRAFVSNKGRTARLSRLTGVLLSQRQCVIFKKIVAIVTLPWQTHWLC